MSYTHSSSSPLRSLQLGKSWFPEQQGSGLDRMYYGLSRWLPTTGVAFDGLIAGTTPERQVPSVHPFAADTASLPERLLGVRRSVRRHLAETPTDLIVSHFALYTVPALDLLDGRPMVVHFHGPWAQESAVEGERSWAVRAKHYVETATYRRADQFIVLSEAFRDILCTSYDVDPDRVQVVPGGVDASAFDTGVSRRAAQTRLGWSTDRPIILSVRRLAHRMGLENLIRAMVDVRRAVPDALLLIAGKGPLAPQLAAQIDALELQDHVQLLGFVPDADLPFAYRAATVSVVPTLSLEGFGLITVESMAAGTPVLVTPNGGLPEVVSDLSPALVLDGDTPAALADRLIEILRGRFTLPSAAACQAYARARFDWPVIAAQTRDVYTKALSPLPA